ncbi:hypothetical protein CQ12_35325 [Bradyrhizobium jicamae]|uniref:Uncharacterized protein n=1 Tax=Bradyrhizobium jicamae TaxID=280332 RepID=A0A0R3M8Q5_9BRAD|nr:hypothetical protein [Bradyrhizobium jicamae]KRR14447.1 hypothetical protein CQ12_35325 [Bradyrhizobium jicamae]
MTALYPEYPAAPVAIAALLSAPMSGAWVLQQRTGHPDRAGHPSAARPWRRRDCQLRAGPFFPRPPPA